MLLWRIYVGCNNETYVGPRVKCAVLHRKKKEGSFADRHLEAYSLAKLTVMADMWWSSFLVFVCVCVKHFTRKGGINRL